MYRAELVEHDIRLGRQILDALASAQISVAAALWLYVPQISEWHLIIGTSLVDKKGPRGAYGEVWSIFEKGKLLPLLPLRRLYLMSPKEEFIAALRTTVRTMREGRLTSAYIGGRLIEDAYLYDVRSTPRGN